MNLTDLFNQQRKLDEEIERKHPVQPGEDRAEKKILALAVELGECANEWRGFKFWSTNQEPRNSEKVPNTSLDPLNIGFTVGWTEKNPLLEEYVDCLHFLLSIGLLDKHDQINFHKERIENLEIGITHKAKGITTQFINVYYQLSAYEDHRMDKEYVDLLLTFIALGEMLGFTQQQIEQAYNDKNKTNWERQANGY